MEEDIGKSRDGSRTDDEAVQRSVVITVSQLFFAMLATSRKGDIHVYSYYCSVLVDINFVKFPDLIVL